MKLKLLALGACWLSLACSAQNLIQNSSFEDVNLCPDELGQFEFAPPWSNPSTNLPGEGSPDLFHGCSSNNAVSTPNTIVGYQQPHSGDAYAGYFSYFSGSNFREYLQIPLTTPLEVDSCYLFELYFSIANEYQYATSSIGVYFSDSLITGTTGDDPLPYVPHIQNDPTNFPDTASWTLFTSEYTAQGQESYIIIGNFVSDEETPTIESGGWLPYGFTLVDDVSLTKVTCPVVTNISANTMQEKRLIKIVDILGNETSFSPNQMLIYIYDDGTREKVYRIE